ncbi:hypothetical protein [Winslowiella iniecta]|uniref:Uncharacterized protein n=1 Tax=Winslowiella iniecta TaxID=1560201 RepID=A0A0L7T212_9GAMM|nr:hypothetical protein [Winslowiella iniecta]KOC89281.1 hypothetical protein NG42_13215 [Winslowiella iniecta]KOC94848.1 hypothetical protein NG43_03480 [Winslowiella iniecta]
MPFISKKKLELETKIIQKSIEFRERDNINEAIKRHYELLHKLYLTNPLYFKTIFKANRFIIGSAILGIYYTRNGSTFKDIKKFCIANDLLSINALDSFLLFLRVGGRLEVYRDESDKRKLNYKPTAKALSETKKMINTMLIPCAMLSAEFDLAYYENYQNFVPAFFKSYAEITLNRIFVHDMVPGSGDFLSRDGGHMIMFNLYLESIKQNTLDVNYNFLKASFSCGVSRSHIKRCLQAVEQNQLLTIVESKHIVSLTPAFMQMVRDYFALYLASVKHGLTGMPAETG